MTRFIPPNVQVRPKLGKIDIDYQKLHDAFFKWQTKPKMTIHGDLYYEGKEFETRLKEKKPGKNFSPVRRHPKVNIVRICFAYFDLILTQLHIKQARGNQFYQTTMMMKL